jgi:hypothetical protein
MSTGPVAINVDNIGLGLAQIRVFADWKAGGGSGEELISLVNPEITVTNSIGKLTGTKMNLAQEYYNIESGYPKRLNKVVPLKSAVSFEGALHEITPKNIELALGKTPTAASASSGSVGFGSPVAPIYVRMEAWFVFPDGALTMVAILPRCQVTSSFELNMSDEGEMSMPCKFEASDASSSNADITTDVWDLMPLGALVFGDLATLEAAANLGQA